MCNRFALPKPEEIAAHFELGEIPSLAPRYNVAPGETILVVRREGETRVLDSSAWGLQPGSRGAQTKPVLNLRAESLRSSAEKGGSAARRGRGLVPAGGFFEWRHVGRARQPWYFRMKDAPLLALAALCDEPAAPPGMATDSPVRRCAIVTTEPNELVAEVHDRMPVIISRDAYGAWLDPSVPLLELLPLLAPFPVEAMVGYPVSSVVNRAGVEDPRAIEPARQESLF